MIVVEITLVSAVNGAKTRLGVMTICNDGTGTEKHGNYTGEVLRKPDFKTVTRAAGVDKYPRQDKPIWALVARMLVAMGYGQ